MHPNARQPPATSPVAGAARRPAVANLCVMLLVLAGSTFEARAVASVRSQTQISRKPALEAVVQATRVQLGSWRSAIEAARGWNLIQRRAADAMDGLSARVVPAVLPGRGTFYRLWVGPVDRAAVTRFCASLRARHIACIPAPR